MEYKLTDEIKKIDELIKELESSRPKFDNTKHRFDEENRPFFLHCIKIQDAYWRQRMLIAEQLELDLAETATVY